MRGEAAPDEEEITAQHLAAFAEREGLRALGIQPRSSTRQAYGRLVLVRNPDAGVRRLPRELCEALGSDAVLARIGAAWRLGQFARDISDPARATAAKRLLESRLHQEGEPTRIVCSAIEEFLEQSALGSALAAAREAQERAEARAAELSRDLEAKAIQLQNEIEASEQRQRSIDRLFQEKSELSATLQQSEQALREAGPGEVSSMTTETGAKEPEENKGEIADPGTPTEPKLSVSNSERLVGEASDPKRLLITILISIAAGGGLSVATGSMLWFALATLGGAVTAFGVVVIAARRH
ncbi:MAG: hypothetical protein JOZ05_09195 [Acetobacteraceae bacterium]|nr:hypothetical protein [Acetobacteraceae bacterium]